MLLLWKVVWNLCRWHMFHFFHHQKKKKVLPRVKKWNMIPNKDIAGGCNPLGLIISLGFLWAIHLQCDRSVLCYPNVLFAQNAVSPGTFSLWHIPVKINVIYPQPILDLWPPSIAEGWCGNLSYFYFLFKMICHIHELITPFLKRHQPTEPKQSINHLYSFWRFPDKTFLPNSWNLWSVGCLYLAGCESNTLYVMWKGLDKQLGNRKYKKDTLRALNFGGLWSSQSYCLMMKCQNVLAYPPLLLLLCWELDEKIEDRCESGINLLI